MNLVDQVMQQVRQEVAKGIEAAKAAGKFDYAEMPAFIVEVPKDKEHGDFATNAAMMLTKQAKKNPREIAQAIADAINTENSIIEKIEIAGPGFINFYLSNSWMYTILPEVEVQDEKYGFVDIGHGEKIQVEFVSANPTGVLHMGNARGGAMGDSLGNLLAMAGYEVTKEYYINDAGNQIVKFGESLDARYHQQLGEVDYPFPEKGYQGKDIIDTVDNIIARVGNSYMELSEEERREKLIAEGLEEKLGAIRTGLSDFGVEYDVWFSELSLHESGAIKEVVDQLTAKGMTYEKDGALWLKTTQFGDIKDEVLIRQNGIPTYFAADIAYHKNKFDRGFGKVINIWGADHHGHVARLKGAMDALGYDGNNLTVILMQLVKLFEIDPVTGEKVEKKMSKRTGQFVALQELVEDIGKDAARFFFVMRNPDSQLDFDLDLAKEQSSDNPVYYVQYAHARIHSILAATGKTVPKATEVNLNLLQEESELNLIRKIADLPNEIAYAAGEYEPYRLARYAIDLATAFHSFYNSCRVLTDEEDLRDARLVLVNATRITLRNVLHLLGVTAPERM